VVLNMPGIKYACRPVICVYAHYLTKGETRITTSRIFRYVI